MNPLRALRYLIGLGVLVYLVVLAIAGAIDAVTYRDHDRVVENLRQSRDIIHMWSAGVSPATIPNLKPSQARNLLQKSLAMKAEDVLKNDVRKLLAELDAKPHYYAFAEHAAEFAPLVPKARTLEEPDPPGKALDTHVSGKLLVISQREPTRAPKDAAEAEPFFDADLIEALGDRAAIHASEVAAVILIQAETQLIGQYQMTGFVINGKTIKFDDLPKRKGRPALEPYSVGNAYRELWAISVRDYPSGRLHALKLLGADDPDKMPDRQGVSSAHEEIRVQAVAYLKFLPQ